jgi:hypothetical protein
MKQMAITGLGGYNPNMAIMGGSDENNAGYAALDRQQANLDQATQAASNSRDPAAAQKQKDANDELERTNQAITTRKNTLQQACMTALRKG